MISAARDISINAPHFPAKKDLEKTLNIESKLYFFPLDHNSKALDLVGRLLE